MKIQFLLSKHILAVVLVLLLSGNTRNAAAQEITGLSDWTLFIDQGHSQTENMGLYNYSEAQKVLRVGLALRGMFLEQTDIDTVYTARMTDQDNISLEGRTALANTLGVDFYYSIHSDAGPPAVNSTLMLYGGWKSNGELVEKTPEGGGALGAILDLDLTGTMRIDRRGNFADRVFYQGDVFNHENHWPYLHVNRESNMTSLLSEAGFHTNPTQQMRNMNAEWKVLEALSAFRSFLQWHELDRPAIGVATGIITDIETGLALNDVTVTIGDEVYVTDGYESLFNQHSTNPEQLRNGFYFIDSLTPNTTVQVQLEKEGYQSLTIDLDIVSNPNGLTEENLSFLDPQLVSFIPPVVDSAEPADEFDALIPGTPLVLEFSRKMNPETTQNAISMSPEATMSFNWINEFTLEINTIDFAYLQPYTLTIDGSVATNQLTGQFLDGDADGTEGGDYVIDFTMSDEDTDAPALVDFSPSEDTPARMLRPVVRLVYDETILDETVTESAVVITPAGSVEPVAGIVDHQVVNEQSVIHFFPTEDLMAGSMYNVTVAAGLSDMFNNVTVEQNIRFYIVNEPITETTVIDDFNAGVGSWWTPQQAGQTSGIITELTSRTHNIEVVNQSVGSTGSMKLNYAWDPDFIGDSYIRQYLPPTAPQNGIRFNSDDVLQVYVFGDGTGNRIRMMIRDGLNQLEAHQWVTVDWIGWKLVSWDLDNEPAVAWVNGDGNLDGANFYMDGFHVTSSEGSVDAGAIYFDHLHFVKKAETQYPTTLFENWQEYEDFTTDIFPWYTVDVDSVETWNPAGFTFPGASEPYAFKVMNPATTEPPITENHPAVDGDKYLIAMMSQKIGEDKWLISPQLRATDLTQLSFWAKSIEINNFGPERMQVYISLDDTETFSFNPDDFTMISDGDFIEVPADWTQYSWFLGDSVGQVYRFAVRYVSQDDYMIMLDKIEVADATTYLVNATVTPDATGTVEGTGSYAEGQEVTLTASPAVGHVFVRWEDAEGTLLSEEPTYTFSMPAQDVDVIAVFAVGEYALTLKALPEAGGTLTGAGSYLYESEVTVNAATNEGYLFIHWADRQGNTLSTDPEFSFIMPGMNYELNAIFELQPVFYTLALIANPNEGGVLAGGGEYEEGESVILSATPSNEYLFVNWTDDQGNVVNTSDFFTYTMPASDVTLTGNFQSGTSISELEINNPTVFPNPANNHIYFRNDELIKSVSIIEITGKTVLFSENIDGYIAVDSLPGGLYIVRIETDSDILFQKIQISR